MQTRHRNPEADLVMKSQNAAAPIATPIILGFMVPSLPGVDPHDVMGLRGAPRFPGTSPMPKHRRRPGKADACSAKSSS
jgi:hypothetical protein